MKHVFLRALLVVLATCGAHVRAGERIAGWKADDERIEVSLTSVFDPPPPTGCQPVLVNIRNGGVETRTWRFDFTSTEGYRSEGAVRSSFRVEVEAGKAVTQQVIVPLVRTGSHYYGSGHSLSVIATTPGLDAKSDTQHDERVGDRLPAIAMSKALAETSLVGLNNHLSSSSSSSRGSLFASQFDPAELPEDWLGLSGFDFMFITRAEWDAVSPGARNAVLQWVRGGGRLEVYDKSDASTLSFLGLGDSRGTSVGRGGVYMQVWDGVKIAPVPTVGEYQAQPARAAKLDESWVRGWSLQFALGERSFAGWQVIIFLVVFGIIVAPVNLFVLAPSGRRQRLFLTTPAISVGASLLLIGLILLQDGTGGKGRRLVAVELFPDQATACVVQEQISRTGVLLRSGFTVPDGTLLEEPTLMQTPWTKREGHDGKPLEASFDGTNVGGNWFQSRSVQAQRLQRFVPTRGRVEYIAPAEENGAPTVVSSLDCELQAFAYTAKSGQVWTLPEGTTLKAGQRVTLVKGAMPPAILAARGLASEHTVQAVTAASAAGRFIALAQEAPTFAIPTHGSIKWEQDTILIFGTLHP